MSSDKIQCLFFQWFHKKKSLIESIYQYYGRKFNYILKNFFSKTFTHYFILSFVILKLSSDNFHWGNVDLMFSKKVTRLVAILLLSYVRHITLQCTKKEKKHNKYKKVLILILFYLFFGGQKYKYGMLDFNAEYIWEYAAIWCS